MCVAVVPSTFACGWGGMQLGYATGATDVYEYGKVYEHLSLSGVVFNGGYFDFLNKLTKETLYHADIQVDGVFVTVKRSELHAVDVNVPADISSAAYFMALGALKGKTLCKNVGVNPTRTGILAAFDRLGVGYNLLNQRISGGEERADILVKKSEMRAITLTEKDVPAMVDELPLIALLCAFADGESRITGASELRVKESDRIQATAELINNLGGDCTPLPDGWIIRGKETLQGGDADSYLDHRIAMTAAVGMIASKKGGNIFRPACCAISFPDFFQKLGVKIG